jgi:hypothetical protein
VVGESQGASSCFDSESANPLANLKVRDRLPFLHSYASLWPIRAILEIYLLSSRLRDAELQVSPRIVPTELLA